jgi:hypothetical protein
MGVQGKCEEQDRVSGEPRGGCSVTHTVVQEEGNSVRGVVQEQ